MEEKTISVRELQDKLSNNDNIFVLDVRPTEQRNEWKIDGSAHVDAYTQLRAGDDHALDAVSIPKGSTVVTVCAAGRTSLIASKLLERKGIVAYSLEGGMKAWNYAWNTAEVVSDDGIRVIQVRRPAKGVLSYVVGSGSEAIVIDSALDPSVYQKIASDHGWTIRYAADTHIHADYVSRTRELAASSDAKHLFSKDAQTDFDFTPVSDGDIIPFGESELHVMHTPGHTWESTTFRIGKFLFTGDTLFIDGIGRPDLKADHDEAAAKAKALYQSLRRLISLAPEVVVLPAHASKTVAFDQNMVGDPIRVVMQRIHLPETETEFVQTALSKVPPTPPNYQTIAGLNRTGSYDGLMLADLEAGGNHCAIA